MASGGWRAGSGPMKGAKYKNGGKTKAQNKKTDIPADIQEEAAKAKKDPLTYMLDVMNDEKADAIRRDRMAVAAAPFCHTRKGEGAGKKQEKDEKAKNAAAGKFAAGRAPLTLVK